jgi:hypothetical protein
MRRLPDDAGLRGAKSTLFRGARLRWLRFYRGGVAAGLQMQVCGLAINVVEDPLLLLQFGDGFFKLAVGFV